MEMSKMITRKVRETNTDVSLWKSADGWVLHCDEHGLCCVWPTKKEALEFMPYPSNYCEECCQIIMNGDE